MDTGSAEDIYILFENIPVKPRSSKEETDKGLCKEICVKNSVKLCADTSQTHTFPTPNVRGISSTAELLAPPQQTSSVIKVHASNPHPHYQHTDSQYQERSSTDDQDQDWQQQHRDLSESYTHLNNFNTMETTLSNLHPPTTTRPTIEKTILEEVCLCFIF